MTAFRGARLGVAMLLLAQAASCAAAAPKPGEVIRTAEELASALSAARGGETLVLAPGNYGEVKARALVPASQVTIVSQDPQRPAQFARLIIDKSSNLLFRSIAIGSPLAPGEGIVSWTAAVRIHSGDGIGFDRVRFSGVVDDDALNDRVGLFAVDSSKIAISDSQFDNLHNGLHIGSSDGVSIRNSVFRDIRVDGANFVAVQGIVIDGNRFSDFRRQEQDHADAIQFWTMNAKRPSTDITIANNVILQGRGSGSQGIFMGNEMKIPYERVRIVNNLIYVNSEWNAILLDRARDVVITDNSTLSQPDDKFASWIRLGKIEGLTIDRNVADSLLIDGKEVSPSGENISLKATPRRARGLADLAAGAAAQPLRLVVAGVGYQMPKPAP